MAPTLKGTEASWCYVQCFLYLVSRISNDHSSSSATVHSPGPRTADPQPLPPAEQDLWPPQQEQPSHPRACRCHLGPWKELEKLRKDLEEEKAKRSHLELPECAGESLAKMELFLFFTSLMQKAHPPAAPGGPHLDLDLSPDTGSITQPMPHKDAHELLQNRNEEARIKLSIAIRRIIIKRDG